jgi:glutamyl-tRNA reductase
VQVAREVGGDLDGRGVLVLGAGTMSALAARRMHESGAHLLIASRGGESAVALATALSGGSAAITDPVSVADDVDVIISCTNSAATVLSAAEVAAMQERRGHRPLTIVDIAVPRDVEAAAGEIAGVTLVDVDALGGRVAGGGERGALAEATALIEAEVAHAITVVGERDMAGPTIGALVRHGEAVRREEVERTLARLGSIDSATAERIQQLTKSIVNKLLHAPISHLREFADDPGVALTLRDAFDLDASDAVADVTSDSSAAAS